MTRSRAEAARVVVVVVAVLAVLLCGAVQPASAASRTSAASLVLSPSSGPVGTVVSASGAGFPRTTSVTVTLGSASVLARTDRKGMFVARLTVPTAASGDAPVRATAGTSTASAVFAVTAPPSLPGVRFGVTTAGGPRAASELDEVTNLAGEAPSIVMWYQGFGQEVDLAGLDAVASRGAQPLITWEPYDWASGTDQPRYSLARITAGDFDPYLRRSADSLRQHGRPVMLRFAHEMNGSWYPWSEGVNGNSSGEYVEAWRHVHGIFAAAGAGNVSWVWSPNVVYPGSTPLAGLYPGSAYVDVVALDGYNWGTAFSGRTWQSPAQVFDASMTEIRTVAPGKPVVIAETASAEDGGSKATWIRDLFTWLDAQPDVTAFVWFHHDKETDWRISSSAASATAFADGLAGRRG